MWKIFFVINSSAMEFLWDYLVKWRCSALHFIMMMKLFRVLYSKIHNRIYREFLQKIDRYFHLIFFSCHSHFHDKSAILSKKHFSSLTIPHFPQKNPQVKSEIPLIWLYFLAWQKFVVSNISFCLRQFTKGVRSMTY